MHVSIHIGFEQLREALSQLSLPELAQLQEEITRVSKEREKSSINREQFKALLFKGPVLGEEEIAVMEETRKAINQWRKQ